MVGHDPLREGCRFDHVETMATPEPIAGLEPATPCLQGRCSSNDELNRLEPHPGFEPGPLPYEGSVRPWTLERQVLQSRWQESNLHHILTEDVLDLRATPARLGGWGYWGDRVP